MHYLTLFRIGIFTLFFLFSSWLHGQTHSLGTPEILNFSKSTYKAGTQNWSILQGENGIVYFGNNKGVLEHDGVNWELLEMPNRTVVRSLAMGPDNHLYIGAQDELGYISSNDSHPYTYHSLVQQIPEAHRSFDDIWGIFPIGNEVFFCSQKAVFRFESNQCDVFLPPGRFENFFAVGDQIFAQDLEFGLLVFDGERFTSVPGGNQFTKSRIAAMLPFGESILIISDMQGLFRMQENAIQPWDVPANDFLRNNQAYCALQLKDDRFAIGTAQDGLILADPAGNILLHLNQQSGLQNNTILSIFQDRQNNLWLGLDNGIDYIAISSPFSLVQSHSGIKGTGYASMLYDDVLYLGTNQGLFYKEAPPSGSEFEFNPLKRVPNLQGQVWSLDLIAGDLIVSMHEGTFLLDKKKARPISLEQSSWKIMELQNRPGIAIGGTYSGLLIYEKGARGRWKLRNKVNGFNESARVIAQDPIDGSIWISHAYKGLYRVLLNEALTDAEVDFFGVEDGLPSNISINVAKIRDEIIFTTPQGVYRFERNEGRFEPYEKFNASLGGSQFLYRLIEDEAGWIWFSTDKEFGYLQVMEKGFLQEKEIQKSYFNHLRDGQVDGFEHIYHTEQGKVFIGTEQGFIHYAPAPTPKQDAHFTPLIKRITSIVGVDSILFKGKADEPPKFSYQLNSLRFAFAAPYYEPSGQIMYRYKLEGFEDDWSEWSSRTEKEFTNLPHGKFTLHLEARNSTGLVSQPTQFEFSISPPWYATVAAKAVYFLVSALFLIGAFLFYSSKLEREKAAIVKAQENTLAQKEAEFQEEKEKSEAEIIQLRNNNLKADIQHKNSQLASATMHLVQKGEILIKIKRDLKKLVKNASTENKRKLQQLIHIVDDDIRLDNDWKQFEMHFDQVHEDFLKNLREVYPQLTPKDQKLCAYLRMNLTTKDIAPLMNISVRGVEIARYRLRKKLELETDVNLVDYIMKF